MSRTSINWGFLQKCPAGLWKDTVMDNIYERYDRFVHHLRDSAKDAMSLKNTKRRFSPESLELRADTPAWSSTSVRVERPPSSPKLRQLQV
ncbi:unnamed protein product [Heligmosomoides polygyrus]|uniref:Uncharacterized protein n=1 Tax=Heligmosomoides polygyrus TaxID=6339 RepID=A0A183GCI2_HELPZ|nr:unnamed protein product [Heligmosomoides polygyrus]